MEKYRVRMFLWFSHYYYFKLYYFPLKLKKNLYLLLSEKLTNIFLGSKESTTGISER